MGGPTSLSSDRQAVCEARLRSLVRQLGRSPHGRRPSRRSQHRLGSRRPNAKQCPRVFQPLTQREEYRSFPRHETTTGSVDRRMPASPSRSSPKWMTASAVRSSNGRRQVWWQGPIDASKPPPPRWRERFFGRLIFGESPALHGV